jgi:hypothetical protein
MSMPKWNNRVFGKISGVLLAISVIVPSMAYAINTPRLHVNGIWLNDPQGNRVVLRGVAVIPPGDQASRGGFDFIAGKVTEPNMYCRVVRVPVSPGGWNASSLTGYLKPCVDALTKKNVYVIIDLHYISNYGSLDATVKSFWTTVAPAFKDYTNVFYEVFNEPISPGGQAGWETWKATAQPWVDLIRAAAPSTPIIVGSPTWCQDTRFAVTSPFKGDNLIYTTHIYPVHKNWGLLFGDPSTKIPVFLSEWGYQNAGSYGPEVKGTTSVYGQQMKDTLAAHPNINWTSWIFDYSWYPWMVDKNYVLLGGEDYQGVFMQTFLNEKRNDNLPGVTSKVNYSIVKSRDRQGENPALSLFTPSLCTGGVSPSAWGFGVSDKEGTIVDVLGRSNYPLTKINFKTPHQQIKNENSR